MRVTRRGVRSAVRSNRRKNGSGTNASFRWLAGWSRDLQLGARMVVKDPGLTLIATLALTVAIGAGAGYFEFINKLFRGAFPVAAGDRIVGIYNWDASRGESDDDALHDFEAWRA